MSNDMYLPALIEIAKQFQVSDNWLQLTITAWLAGSASLQLIFGPISDRYGRRPVMFLGGVIFILSTLGCAMSPNAYWLLGYRYFQGMSVSSLMVTGYASVHELYSEKRATRVLSWLGCAAVVAPMLGPLLGSYVLLFSTWRMIFLLLAALSFISIIGLYFVMPESASTDEAEASLNPVHIGLTYFRMIRNTKFVLHALPTGLLYAGIIVWLVGAPFLIIQELKYSPQMFGYLQIPIFASYIIGAQWMKILTHSISLKALAKSGLTIAAIGAIVLLIVSWINPSHVISLIAPMSLYTFGCGFGSAPLTRITIDSSGEKLGATTAFFYLKLAGLGAIGSGLVSIFYNGTMISVTSIIAGFIVLAWVVHFLHRSPKAA